MDRIMLMTFDDPPTHLKVGWRESLLVFQNELKNMQPTAVMNGSHIISSAFELLNVNRLQTGIDTYGQGRNPYFVDSSVVILLTDGQSFLSQPEISITMNSRIPGMELTREPFRWDQRFFSVIIRIPGVRGDDKPIQEEPVRDTSVLEGFSCMTGGRSFVIDSMKVVDPIMLKIADSMQNGVMVRLEPLEEAAFSSTSIAVNRMIYLPRNPQKNHATGHWPLPEPFWPTVKTQSVLPPRNAHPILRYKPCMEDPPPPLIINGKDFPVDKYEVENSPLTQEIAEKSERFKHWQVFVDAEVPDSEPTHQLCGYLALQINGPERTLMLHVLPLDYVNLWDLLDKIDRNSSSNKKEWRAPFDAYIQSIPGYYACALRRVLSKFGGRLNLIPESFDQFLSFEVQNHLRRSKTQAKLIFDSTQAFPNQPFPVPDLIPVLQRNWKDSKRDIVTASEGSPQKEAFDDLLAKSVAEQMEADASTFRIHLRCPPQLSQRANTILHRNPFDVEREDLVSQLSSLKFSLMHPTQWKGSEEPDRNIPIAQMGNYQEYLKSAAPPLRDIDETPKFERPLFGNPFLNKKKQRMASGGMGGMVDEADVEMGGPGGGPPRIPRRSFSEPREFAPGILGSRVRSRSASPAGLRSPIKHGRPDEVTEPNAMNSDALTEEASSHTTTSKRRLVMGLPDDQAIQSLIDIPAVEPVVVNGVEDDVLLNGEIINGKVDVAAKEPELDTDMVQQIRLKALSAMKKPGRNFKPILDMINEVNGNLTLKKAVIENIIAEAGRFRRDSLINLLKETYAV